MSNQSNRVGKQHLIEIAEQLFTAHGYQAVSIRDIATAAGVTNAALYYHFPNKTALFGEVLEQHVSKLGTRLQQAGRDGKFPQERVIRMLLVYGEHVANRRSPMFSLRHKPPEFTPEQARDHHRHIMTAMLQPIENELRIAIKNGELKSLDEQTSPAALLLGLLHGLLQHRRTCVDGDLTRSDVEMVVDIFWNGLKSNQ
jgi:TetR/AcrR family transcriptional regulator, cholesterol catabolism regulator